MLELYIRPVYQKFLVDPVAAIIQNKYAYSANGITLFAGIFGILSALLLSAGFSYLAVLLLLFSGYCDTLDGTVARLNNSISAVGTVMDIITDRIIEFAIIFALFSLNPADRSYAAMAMLGSVLICVTSFLIVGVFTENASNKSFHYSPGLIERAEAFIFFIVMILKPGWFNWLAWLFTALVFYTALIRIYQFCKINQHMH